MFQSLRGRLLLSFTAVISAVLFAVAVAALVIGSLPRVRYVPTLQQLDAISRISRSEILRLAQAGTTQGRVIDVLQETAVQNNVRVLFVTLRDRQIRFDSADGSWVGEAFTNLRPLNTGDAGAVAAVYTAPNASRWLIYTREIDAQLFGAGVIVYAKPEPTRLALFRELGLGMLLTSAGCLTFLLAILLALAIAAWVARPLQKMAGAAEAIAQGDYDQQLALQGPAEVQRVASSFNTMSQQVAATRQAQRDFVANVSHDLKTPITSIQGWSQALLDGTAVDHDTQQQAAGVIHSEAERMSRMVRQLLDLARIESGQLELHQTAVDLSQVIADVAHNLSVRAQGQGIELIVQPEPVPPVWGDYDRLMQVFTNLVDNALTHTPAGGTVRLRVQHNHTGQVEVAVQDTGRGIAPDELSRIFERFYQVDKSRQQANQPRSGLGLAIVQELVQLHNGRISAHSQPGKGSTFIVQLPASQPPS